LVRSVERSYHEELVTVRAEDLYCVWGAWKFFRKIPEETAEALEQLVGVLISVLVVDRLEFVDLDERSPDFGPFLDVIFEELVESTLVLQASQLITPLLSSDPLDDQPVQLLECSSDPVIIRIRRHTVSKP
jgi:hypothetical protein